MPRARSLHLSPLLGVATAVVALAIVLCGSNSVHGVRVAPGMHTTTSDKLMIGYFFNLFKVRVFCSLLFCTSTAIVARPPSRNE